MRATTLPPILVPFLLPVPLLVAALSSVGCDSKKSGEGESCTKTADCTGELRCVDEHCVTKKAKSKSKRDKKRKPAAATAKARPDATAHASARPQGGRKDPAAALAESLDELIARAKREAAASEGQPEPGTLSGSKSCEAAIHAYVEPSGGKASKPTAASGNVASILNKGTYLAKCSVPPSMELFICTAIQQGAVQGVTVITKPGHSEIRACVTAQVRKLSFPSKPTMDVARTHFAAAE